MPTKLLGEQPEPIGFSLPPPSIEESKAQAPKPWIEESWKTINGKRYGPYLIKRWRDERGKKRSQYLGKAPQSRTSPEQVPNMYQPDTEIIDRLSVKQLRAKVDLPRTTFYARIKALGIEFEQAGQSSYATAHQIQLIEEYGRAIARGEGDAFLKNLHQPEAGKYEITPMPSQLVEHQLSQVEAIAQLLAPLLPTKNLLEPQRLLQEAVDNGWLLSTQQLRKIIGVKPVGPWCSRYGFVFHRLGREWIISKRDNK